MIAKPKEDPKPASPATPLDSISPKGLLTKPKLYISGDYLEMMGNTPLINNSILNPSANFFPKTPSQEKREADLHIFVSTQKDSAHSPVLKEILKLDTSVVRKERNISEKIKRFRNLINLLHRVFLSQKLDETDLRLTQFDLNIIEKLALRKFGVKSLLADVSPYDLRKICFKINELKMIKSSKRIEENNKFIMKHAFKNLSKLLKIKLKINVSNKNFEQQFYHYYFDEVLSRRPDLKIEDFFDPLTSSDSKNSKIKTLSSNYLELIFQSNLFRKDFVFHLSSPNVENSLFVKIYQRTIVPKLEKIFAKWESKIGAEQEASLKLQMDILSYFEKNNQCKIPWSTVEVTTAINSFLTFVETIKP